MEEARHPLGVLPFTVSVDGSDATLALRVDEKPTTAHWIIEADSKWLTVDSDVFEKPIVQVAEDVNGRPSTRVVSCIFPLRRPHVGALHVVLVGSRPDLLGIDSLQVEELLRTGSIVCGNFGGASLEAIQTRKKLAALNAVISAPEGSAAGVPTAHILAGKQLEVRG